MYFVMLLHPKVLAHFPNKNQHPTAKAVQQRCIIFTNRKLNPTTANNQGLPASCWYFLAFVGVCWVNVQTLFIEQEMATANVDVSFP